MTNNDERKAPVLRFKGFTDDWEQRKLNSLVTMHARIGWQGLRKNEFLESGNIYIITGTDFYNGKINFRNISYIGKDRYTQDKNIQIHPNDILLTKDGTIGKIAYIDKLDKPATLNAGIYVIRKKGIIDRRYLFQYLRTNKLLKYAKKSATGGTIKHLNQNILVDFPVEISTLAEEKRISILLDKIDDLISLQQRKLKIIQTIKKVIIQIIFSNSNWKKIRLGQVTRIRGGYAFSSKEFKSKGMPIIKISNILENGMIGGDYQFIQKENKFNKFKLTINDILIAMSGATTGKIAVINENKIFYQNQRVGLFTKTNNIDYLFLSYLLQTVDFKKNMQRVLITGAQPNISSKDIENFSFKVPKSRLKQKQIGSLLKNIDKIILKQEKLIKYFKYEKKFLLQNMFI